MAIRTISSTTAGIDVDTSSDLWVLRDGFSLGNAGDAFDFLTFSNSTLLVEGLVYSQTDAIDSDDGSSFNTVTVSATGTVYGVSDGIELGGNDHEVFNYGTVTGVNDRGIQMIGDNGEVVNTGTVSGQSDGLSLEGNNGVLINHGSISSAAYDGVNVAGTGNYVSNSGQIVGARHGLEFNTVLAETNTLVNAGTITGNATAVRGDFGDERVINSGTLLGVVDLLGGADFFNGNGGTVSGTVLGGAGDDTLQGGENADVMEGGDDADLLIGRGGDDVLAGDAGNDMMLGGAGNDSMTGGNNNDTMNGNAGDDTMEGGAGNDILVGQDGSDFLDGGTLEDTLDGGNGDDVLEGDSGNDILRGRAGEDDLAGGLGRDFLTGGQDADQFVFRSTAETVVGADRDQILDFEQGLDSIVVAGLSPGVFEFRGTSAFAPSGNPELRLLETATGSTIVQLDVDGDGAADAEIRVANVTGLTAEDFVL
ncbi:calcium-binding protein [uncultured Mameliella sp.]|uniref:calcium-binding protein n=1 Tax=uncultured Mameliella sp. TaxID=1447087 RepID=UPI002606D469|nr:calcium-binding protein [uncultured Mameliella sp.]